MSLDKLRADFEKDMLHMGSPGTGEIARSLGLEHDTLRDRIRERVRFPIRKHAEQALTDYELDERIDEEINGWSVVELLDTISHALSDAAEESVALDKNLCLEVELAPDVPAIGRGAPTIEPDPRVTFNTRCVRHGLGKLAALARDRAGVSLELFARLYQFDPDRLELIERGAVDHYTPSETWTLMSIAGLMQPESFLVERNRVG